MYRDIEETVPNKTIWDGSRPSPSPSSVLSSSSSKGICLTYLFLVKATVQSSGGSVSCTETSDGSLVRRPAASMLSGKKTVQTIPANQKGASVKSGVNKKGDGGGQSKSSKVVEPVDIEPVEISLEEIENKLGSLIQVNTVVQLKSAVWKERLEVIVSFKEQVEALQALDPSVEILIRLLCVVPGWSEKNVQACPATGY
ncbi:Protein MOR1 [Forsythia ovata]|uniref:Protein MOR1 n=1 Tax=Forsythia ovata TaxID=205694 RepID=A0ABD1SRE3_9LAMI